MASINKRKSCYAVIYRYLTDDKMVKQKWESFDSLQQASLRKSHIEYYQQFHGYILVPNEPKSISSLNNQFQLTIKQFLTNLCRNLWNFKLVS